MGNIFISALTIGLDKTEYKLYDIEALFDNCEDSCNLILKGTLK